MTYRFIFSLAILLLSGCAANKQYPSGSLGQEVTDAFLEGFIPGTPTLTNLAREIGRKSY